VNSKHTLAEVKAQLAKADLAEFVRQAWHVLEPETPLVWGWHVDAICQHLEAVTEGEIKRLLINVPPGHMKSLLVSVFWPAWMWLKYPGWRALFGSYDMGLSTRDSVKCRTLIQSEWYRRTFAPAWKLRGDQNIKTWFENTAGGLRMALAVGGKGTGFRADAVIFDDPLNVKRSPSENDLEEVQFWWDKRMSSRLSDPLYGVRVGIMQRLHEDDLSGHLLRRKSYQYTHLCLPTEYDPEKLCATHIGFVDPRKEPGELLFPAMFSEEAVAETKVDLGLWQFAGQHNQNPTPHGGGILKRHWLRFWYPSEHAPPPVRVVMEDGSIHLCKQIQLPDELTYKISSTDAAFKDKSTGSYVAMAVFGAEGARRFWLDLICEHLDFVKTLAHHDLLRTKWPDCTAHLIEDKANGSAIMSVLQDKVPGLLPVSTDGSAGSKIARCEAEAPSIEAGNLYLPHPDLYPWVEPLILELCTFPKSKNNDRVDAMTQALSWMRVKGAGSYDYQAAPAPKKTTPATMAPAHTPFRRRAGGIL
jgi:predicted phage terminase large subunit-like protein